MLSLASIVCGAALASYFSVEYSDMQALRWLRVSCLVLYMCDRITYGTSRLREDIGAANSRISVLFWQCRLPGTCGTSDLRDHCSHSLTMAQGSCSVDFVFRGRVHVP